LINNGNRTEWSPIRSVIIPCDYIKESISIWRMLSGRSRQHFKIHTGVCCIRRMCENLFGALEIVGPQEGKEKEKETGEIIC